MLGPKDDITFEDWIVHFYQMVPVWATVMLTLGAFTVLFIRYCVGQLYWVICRPFIISAGTAGTHFFQYPPLPPPFPTILPLFSFPLFFVSSLPDFFH